MSHKLYPQPSRAKNGIVSNDIAITNQDRVLRIQINRPAKKNALTIAMYQAMTQALEQAGSDNEIRVAVLSGVEGCFTAGNDIGDFMRARGQGDLAPIGKFLETIAGFVKPLVAVVDGIAVGVGTTMLLHCDLIYASERARFKLPFVDLGLVPEAASTILLPQLIGYHRTCELLLLGDELTVDRAAELGLISAIVPHTELTAHADQRIAHLTRRAPGALRATKRLLKESRGTTIHEALVREGTEFAKRINDPEAAEAFTAFMHKRPADFSKF